LDFCFTNGGLDFGLEGDGAVEISQVGPQKMVCSTIGIEYRRDTRDSLSLRFLKKTQVGGAVGLLAEIQVI